jgi:pectate lyase
MNSSVTFERMTIFVKCSQNIILQGLRVRAPVKGSDGIQVNSSANVVIDHCSVSEAGDGAIDITGWSCGQSRNVTVSWSILANTWKQSLVKYNGTTDVTFHHNIFYNSGTRLPDLSEGIFDIRNNLIWQWGSSGTSLGFGARANIINNYYVIGAKGHKPHAAITYRDSSSQAWIDGNVLPMKETERSRLQAPLSVPPVTTQDAVNAKELVIKNAGAKPADPYDEEIIFNIKNNHFIPLPPVVD